MKRKLITTGVTLTLMLISACWLCDLMQWFHNISDPYYNTPVVNGGPDG